MASNVAPHSCKPHRFAAAILLVVSAAVLPQVAHAGSATATLGVSLTIAAGCGVSGASPAGGQPAVNVRCDNAVPYRVDTYRAVVVDTGTNGVNVTVVY